MGQTPAASLVAWTVLQQKHKSATLAPRLKASAPQLIAIVSSSPSTQAMPQHIRVTWFGALSKPLASPQLKSSDSSAPFQVDLELMSCVSTAHPAGIRAEIESMMQALAPHSPLS